MQFAMEKGVGRHQAAQKYVPYTTAVLRGTQKTPMQLKKDLPLIEALMSSNAL